MIWFYQEENAEPEERGLETGASEAVGEPEGKDYCDQIVYPARGSGGAGAAGNGDQHG